MMTSQKPMILMLACATALLLSLGTGCKGKKKLTESNTPAPPTEVAETKPDPDAEKLALIKQELLSLLDDNSTMILDEKESRLNRILAMGLQDPEILDLIRQVQEKLRAEREAMNAANQAQAESASSQLNNSMNEIASASSSGNANYHINQALSLFSSANAPVLIIIHEQGGKRDYDKPTTISKYLNYLKDQSKNPHKIADYTLDANGKISSLELRKK